MANITEEPAPQESGSYVLDGETELRFETSEVQSVELELLSGAAEIFGSELALHRRYVFGPSCKVAVYTWEGCSIVLVGNTEVAYTAKETPMALYLNIHVALEQLRSQAHEQDKRGPRVMIVGPSDVGKSSLCKCLLNYSVRMDNTPVYIDLDVGQGEVGVPGSIGSLVVERPSDPEEGFSQTAPLVFHYGHKSPNDNLDLYNLLITRMAEIVNTRCQTLPKTNHSGVVINTCGWIRGGGYKALVHTAGAFEVDIILVLDNERLHSELKRDMPDFVQIVLLPKSGGVVERSKALRAQLRDGRVREYLYGIRQNYYPHKFEVKFSDVKMFKIGSPDLPESLMPIGMTKQDNKTKLIAIEPSPGLVHHVMSLSLAESTDDDVVSTNVGGFIVITEVHMDRQTFSVLSPCPRPLPKSILLQMEDVTYVEVQ